jgi:hypothetical protein
LIAGDPAIEEAYRAAKKAASFREVEDIDAIVDDDSRDTLPGPKGGEIPNMARVQRARLRAENKQWKAQKFNPEFFSDRQKVEVNINIDHAARLEDARARARDRRATPRPVQEAIDVSFTPAEAPPPAEPEAPPAPFARPAAAELEKAPADFDATWRESESPTDVVAKRTEPESDAPKAEKMWYED